MSDAAIFLSNFTLDRIDRNGALSYMIHLWSWVHSATVVQHTQFYSRIMLTISADRIMLLVGLLVKWLVDKMVATRCDANSKDLVMIQHLFEHYFNICTQWDFWEAKYLKQEGAFTHWASCSASLIALCTSPKIPIQPFFLSHWASL